MSLREITYQLFFQIKNAVQVITPEQYGYKNALLDNASIGEHLRHVIELFQQMISGYATGKVNYENRQRNFLIETDKDFAIQQLVKITDAMNLPNKNLILISDYNIQDDKIISIATNYQREIIYNLEHTIHHMALIRIGFKSAFDIELPEAFGVAPSTLKYRKTCAQ